MTLPLLPNARQQYFGNDGNPLVGGKLYTYAAGTSTPKATYTDSAGTTPNTNPIVLNARGEATIFWDGTYKVTLTDSAGATIYTQDNYTALDAAMINFTQSGAGAVARTAQAKMRENVSIEDFGAVGNGTTSDAAAQTLALNTGKMVHANGGLYNITAANQRYYDARFRTVQATDSVDGIFGEYISITNPTAVTGYGARRADYTHTGTVTSGANTISDTLLTRFQDIRNGSCWNRWDVVTSPLNPASGLTGAPAATQNFALIATEINPQNRHADTTWAGETRRNANWVGGIQIVSETQDFTGLLGTGVRRGYKIAFAHAIVKSPFTNSDQQKHATFNNGILGNPNSISPGGAFIYATGNRDAPSAIAISSGGTGYTAGDILTFNTGLDQSANENTQVRVMTVSAGVITSAEIYVSGWYQQSFASPIGVTGGTGSGATFTYTLTSATIEAPRAFAGIAGYWNYGIDAASWLGTYSNTGTGTFSGAMFRAPNNQKVIVARNAAGTADVDFLKLNTSNQWEVAGKIVVNPTLWTPTITSDTGAFATLTLTSANCRYSIANGIVTAFVAWQIPAAGLGTAAGSFVITLPVPAVAGSVVTANGSNNTDSIALNGYLNGTSVRFQKSDGTSPMANNKFYQATFIYEAA